MQLKPVTPPYDGVLSSYKVTSTYLCTSKLIRASERDYWAMERMISGRTAMVQNIEMTGDKR